MLTLYYLNYANMHWFITVYSWFSIFRVHFLCGHKSAVANLYFLFGGSGKSYLFIYTSGRHAAVLALILVVFLGKCTFLINSFCFALHQTVKGKYTLYFLHWLVVANFVLLTEISRLLIKNKIHGTCPWYETETMS